MDEPKSDVINTVGVPQIQYIDRAVDIPVARGRWCFLFSREACVCSEACDVKIEVDPSMDRRPWF